MNIKILISTLLLCASFVVQAQEKRNDVHIEIVTEHLPPFQVSTPTEILGFATEIVKTAMNNTPYTYNISLYPWSRSYNMALNKENTCIYSIARTPEREENFIWVNTIAERNISFVGLKEKALSITSLEDAKKYKIAVIRDDVTHQFLVSNGFTEGSNLYVINNTLSLLTLLTKRNDIDLILADAYTIIYRAQYDNIDPEVFEKVYQINTQPLDYYLACNTQTSPEIIHYIREAINQMKENGEIERINSKWHYPKIKVDES